MEIIDSIIKNKRRKEMKVKKLIGRSILVLLLILIMAVLVNGQNEEVVIGEGEEANVEVNESQEVAEPVELITRLDVTIIDGMNDDNLIKLKNCIVQVIGEMPVAEDSFTYSNTFVEGDRYEIIMQIRVKK